MLYFLYYRNFFISIPKRTDYSLSSLHNFTSQFPPDKNLKIHIRFIKYKQTCLCSDQDNPKHLFYCFFCQNQSRKNEQHRNKHGIKDYVFSNPHRNCLFLNLGTLGNLLPKDLAQHQINSHCKKCNTVQTIRRHNQPHQKTCRQKRCTCPDSPFPQYNPDTECRRCDQEQAACLNHCTQHK